VTQSSAPLSASGAVSAPPTHRSLAVLLAAILVVLVAYASLYPFTGWAWPAGQPLLALPMPPWRNYFDIAANFAGYVPLAALVFLGGVRSGYRVAPMLLLAAAGPSVLSYAMELTQQFLPQRYPSQLDWMLNTAGALIGTAVGWASHRLRLLDRLQATRDRWLDRRSRGALLLLLLWPAAQLFPTPFPFGVGPSWARVQQALIDLLNDVAGIEPLLAWLQASPPAGSALSPLAEAAGVTLGLCAPILLAYSVAHPGWRRLLLAGGGLALGAGVSALSAALNFGPDHAMSWITAPTVPGALVAVFVALVLFRAGSRLAAVLGIVATTMLVMLVAQAPSDPYYAQLLATWEQGRFVHFHGLAQWVGWLWPLLAAGWMLQRVTGRWSR